MGAVLVVVGVVVVYLLWRLVRAQEQTHQVQRAAVIVHAVQQAAPRITASYERAKAERRLIEWTEEMARDFGLSVEEVRQSFRAQQHVDHEAVLVAESLERGVRCRFLTADDCKPDFQWPGDSPPSAFWCPSQCDDSRELNWDSADATSCVFCGGAVEQLSDDEDRQRWEADTLAWSRFAVLYPEDAARLRDEQRAADAAYEAKRKAEWRAALAKRSTQSGA